MGDIVALMYDGEKMQNRRIFCAFDNRNGVQTQLNRIVHMFDQQTVH